MIAGPSTELKLAMTVLKKSVATAVAQKKGRVLEEDDLSRLDSDLSLDAVVGRAKLIERRSPTSSKVDPSPADSTIGKSVRRKKRSRVLIVISAGILAITLGVIGWLAWDSGYLSILWDAIRN